MEPGTATKQSCLESMSASWAELSAVLARIPPDRLTEPEVIGDWSVRDLLAHFAGYERYVAAEVFATLEGREASSRERYGRDDLPTAAADADEDAGNAWVVDFARTRSVEDAVAEFEWAHHRLVEAVAACPDGALDDPQRFPRFGGRSLAEILPGQCWSHHRQHLPELESWVHTLSRESPGARGQRPRSLP
jgi:Mycothiol maleylpyruvate isomerase N-terminal domain